MRRWFDAGEVGSVELGGGDAPRPSLGWTLVKVAVAVALVVGAWRLAVSFEWPLGDPRLQGAAVSYLLLAWLIRPAPDTSNLGWFGGLVDDPFRVTDDWNRLLLWLGLLLLPGRVV